MPRIDFEYVKEDDLPSPPYVEILLSDYSSGVDGSPLLSPRLYSKSEVDNHINTLVRQLEEVRNKAKSKLK